MTSPDKHSYEQVFTVTDYFDGPRQGIANFNGLPHFYDCIFDEARDEYTDSYHLTPVSPQIFDLAIESWAIWQRWESVFHTGQATLDFTWRFQALPQDRARLEEIEPVLESALKTEKENCIIQVGSFDAIGNPSLPNAVLGRSWQVRWTEPNADATSPFHQY